MNENKKTAKNLLIILFGQQRNFGFGFSLSAHHFHFLVCVLSLLLSYCLFWLLVIVVVGHIHFGSPKKKY